MFLAGLERQRGDTSFDKLKEGDNASLKMDHTEGNDQTGKEAHLALLRPNMVVRAK